MIKGKTFPMKVKTLRFAMIDLLRKHAEEMKCFEDFDNFLESCSSKSVLSKHLIVNFMISVMLILLYIRAEGERDSSLYLYAFVCWSNFTRRFFFFELSRVPKSIITVTKEERFPNNKAVLKNKLKIEV